MSESAHFYKSSLGNGHTDAVLCLQWRRSDGALVTGSEDATCRVWDTRLKRSVQRIGEAFEGNPVSSICFDPQNDNFLYASSGYKIFKFDLRSANVLVSKADAELSIANEAEINEISVHHSGKYLAAGDDNGMVNVFDTVAWKRTRVLRGKHENICSCVRFRPRAAWNLCSGAMDSSLICWDFQNGKTLCKHKVGALEAKDDSFSSAGTSQSFNPPLVHSLSYTADGRYAAIGVGDSTVAVYRHGREEPMHRFVGHKAPICLVRFETDGAGEEGDKLLITASSDRTLKGWQLNLPTPSKADRNKKTRKAEKQGVETEIPECRFVLSLSNKPNWVDIHSRCLALADTSPVVSLYRMR